MRGFTAENAENAETKTEGKSDTHWQIGQIGHALHTSQFVDRAGSAEGAFRAEFPKKLRPVMTVMTRRFQAERRWTEPGAVKGWACTGLAFIWFPLMTAPDVRRGSHEPAGVPDRRSPSTGVSSYVKVTCAHGVLSEGRRPSVRHLCGVMRPAHNKPLRSKSLCERNLHVGRGSSGP